MNGLIDEINKYKDLFERLAPVMFFVKDMQGRYVYANGAFLRFIGGDMTFMYGTSADVFSYSRRQMLMLAEEDDRLKSGQKPMSLRWVSLRNHAGDEKNISVIKVPLYNRADEMCGIMGMGADITQNINAIFVLFQGFMKQLSNQEKQYFFHMARGLSRKEISQVMNITEDHGDTVKSNMRRKLDLDPVDMKAVIMQYRYIVTHLFNE